MEYKIVRSKNAIMQIAGGFSRGVLALVSIALIAALLATTDVRQVAAALSRARIEFVLAALAASLLSLGLKTSRWRALLKEKVDLDFAKLFPVQASGLAVSNLSPGKLLEPLKVVALKHKGVSYGFLVTSVFWERAIDLFVLFSLALGSLYRLDSRIGIALQAASAVLVVAVLAMFRNAKQLLKAASGLPFLKFLEKAEAHDFKKSSLVACFLLTVLAWASDFTAIYFSFLALGMEMNFLQLASAFSAAVLAGIVSFLPGGWGSTEAVFAILLATPAYSPPQILAGVFLGRITTIVFTTLLGLSLLPAVKKKD